MQKRRDPRDSWMPPIPGEIPVIDPQVWSERERQRKRWMLLQAWRAQARQPSSGNLYSWMSRVDLAAGRRGRH